MAQAILSRQLAVRGVHDEVGSAGLLVGGRPLPPETRDALLALGADPVAVAAFRSRELSWDAVDRADLILGLAREHVREVVVRSPQGWDKTFTPKELVRRGEAVGPRPPTEPLEAWLRRVSDGRQRGDLLGSSDEDDVADPIGGTPADFERTAREIERLCAALQSLLWPPGGTEAGRPW